MKVLLFLILPLLLTPKIDAAEFRVAGKGTSLLHHNDGRKQILGTFDFSVERRAQEYRIEMVSVDGENHHDQVISSDGSDCFMLKKMWPSWDDKKAGRNHTEMAMITAGQYPEHADRPLQLLWLVFCSREYLLQNTNHLPASIQHLDYAPTNELKYAVSWLDQNRGLLNAIHAKAPGYILIRGQKIELKNGLANGYNVWKMDVLDRTNTAIGVFPSDIEFRQFFPGDKNPDAPTLVRQTSIKVTEVSLEPIKGKLLPETTAASTMVMDLRHSKGLGVPGGGQPFVQYTIQNSAWKSKDDPKVTQGAAAFLPRAGTKANEKK